MVCSLRLKAYDALTLPVALGWSKKGTVILWLKSYMQLTQRKRKKIEKGYICQSLLASFGIIIRMYATKTVGRLR